MKQDEIPSSGCNSKFAQMQTKLQGNIFISSLSVTQPRPGPHPVSTCCCSLGFSSSKAPRITKPDLACNFIERVRERTLWSHRMLEKSVE